MLTETETITQCINMRTYHDAGVLTGASEGFQGCGPRGGGGGGGSHTNDFTEINIKLGVWPDQKMNVTPPSTAPSDKEGVISKM